MIGLYAKPVANQEKTSNNGHQREYDLLAMPARPVQRYLALDALRAEMMLLGLVIHSAVSYTTTPLGAAWPYQLFVRSTVIGGMLNGRRYPRSLPQPTPTMEQVSV